MPKSDEVRAELRKRQKAHQISSATLMKPYIESLRQCSASTKLFELRKAKNGKLVEPFYDTTLLEFWVQCDKKGNTQIICRPLRNTVEERERDTPLFSVTTKGTIIDFETLHYRIKDFTSIKAIRL